MGTLCVHRDPGISHKDFFAQEFGDSVEILDCHQGREAIYLKCRQTKAPQPTTFVIVCSFSWHRGEYHNFCYKDMDETMGPYECDCPLRFLDGLSPADGYAEGWRERVREWNAARKPAPKVGQRIVFDQPLKFTDGTQHAEFEVVRYRQRGKAYRAPDGRLYKISGIERKQFRVA